MVQDIHTTAVEEARTKIGSAVDSTVDQALKSNAVDLNLVNGLFQSAYKGIPSGIRAKHSEDTATFNDGSTLREIFDQPKTSFKADEKNVNGHCDALKGEWGPSEKKIVACMKENHGAIVASKSFASDGGNVTFDSAVDEKVSAGIVSGDKSWHSTGTLQLGPDLKLVDTSNEKGESLTVSHRTADGGTKLLDFVPPKYGSKEKPILHSVQFVNANGGVQTKILDLKIE